MDSDTVLIEVERSDTAEQKLGNLASLFMKNLDQPPFYALPLKKLKWSIEYTEKWIREFITDYDTHAANGKVHAAQRPMILVEVENAAPKDVALLQSVGAVVLDETFPRQVHESSIESYVRQVIRLFLGASRSPADLSVPSRPAAAPSDPYTGPDGRTLDEFRRLMFPPPTPEASGD